VAHLNIRINNEQVLVLMEVGQLYYMRGELDKAEKVLRGALTLGRDNADVYGSLGAVVHAQGRTEEALGYYQLALQGCPSETCARSNMAQLMILGGNPKQAVEELEKSIEGKDLDDPAVKRASALLQIARILEQQGFTPAAEPPAQPAE